MPGGVNSPVRAFRGVGGTPLFVERAEGASLAKTAGATSASSGPGAMILDTRTLRSSMRSRRPPRADLWLPRAPSLRRGVAMVPSVEMVRMVNSGTEATLSAIRVARGFTGRSKLPSSGLLPRARRSLLADAGSVSPRHPRRRRAPRGRRERHQSRTTPGARLRLREARRRARGCDRGAYRGQHGLRASARGYLERLRALYRPARCSSSAR